MQCLGRCLKLEGAGKGSGKSQYCNTICPCSFEENMGSRVHSNEDRK